MKSPRNIAKDQIAHLLYSVAFFLVLASVAVGLDLLSAWVRQPGVAPFTDLAISLTAHAMMALDMVLFFTSCLSPVGHFQRQK